MHKMLRVWLGPNSSKTVWLVPLVLGASGLQHPRLFWILGQPQVNSIDQHDTHQIHVTKNKIPKHGTFLSDPNIIPQTQVLRDNKPSVAIKYIELIYLTSNLPGFSYLNAKTIVFPKPRFSAA